MAGAGSGSGYRPVHMAALLSDADSVEMRFLRGLDT